MSWSDDATVRARESDRSGAAKLPFVKVLHTPEWLAGEAHLALLVDGEPLVVGRGEDAKLRLKDSRTSREHATFSLENTQVRVVDSSANGTFVDGSRVHSALIDDGAVVRVGDSFLIVRFASPEQADADVPTLVGDSPAIQELRNSIALIAPNDVSVLQVGESGTGKEVVARALHSMSGRRGAFVAVNCAALPKDLAESQLFGHRAGAFTGAKQAHDGFIRAAEGGTLFLDEIGDLPLEQQPKLLRALEERAVIPLGATQPISVDIRLVAATHKDLLAGVDEGWFRGDLYARISDVIVRTPALRDRREDVLPLLRHALEDPRPLAPDLIDALLNAPWRFNVRELFKVGREMVLRAGSAERFELETVRARLQTTARDTPASEPASESPPPGREQLVELLQRHRGNISHVAKAAGRSRKQIYRYLEQHELDPKSYR